jgi:hypothetical protein
LIAAGACIEAFGEDLQDPRPREQPPHAACLSWAYDFTAGQCLANWMRSNLQAKSLLCQTVNQG